MPVIAVVILGVLLLGELDYSLKGAARLDLVLWAAGFIALCIWQSTRPTGWIASKGLEYLGERSFSIYLLHPVVISFSKPALLRSYEYMVPNMGTYAFFIVAAVVLIMVLVVSEVTYRLIEVPGIRFGRKMLTESARPPASEDVLGVTRN